MKSLIRPLTSIGAGMVLENAGTPAAGNGDPFGDDIASMIEGTKWLWPIEFAANTPEAIRWISFGPNKEVKHGWYPQSATWRLVKPDSDPEERT
jgi:hypothetical protein